MDVLHQLMYPEIHALIYGDSGVRKSSMAASFPKPMLVWMFDPHGKDFPYRKLAFDSKELLPDGGLLQYEVAGMSGLLPIKYRDVQHPEGLVRLEYYHDENVENPFSFRSYRFRMALFQNEYTHWKTVVTDSMTFMELSARKEEEKNLNPTAKDHRQWFGGGVDSLEEFICWRYASLPMNVVVICHVDINKNEVSGEILRGPNARGRLSKSGLINAAYQEQYHLYTMRSELGDLHGVCQTTNRDGWVATTQINAPDPCYPHYLSLWENYGK